MRTIEKIINNFASFKSLLVILIIFYSYVAKSSTVEIMVQDYGFSPVQVNVSVGDTIKWTLAGTRPHTTTCNGLFPGTSLPSGATNWDASLNSGNSEFVYKIMVAGNYNYVCTIDAPLMKGSIVAENTLPVELTDFVATTIKNEVILDWATNGEINNDRFEIERMDLHNGDPINLQYKMVGSLSGYGTSSRIHHYSFKDKNVPAGNYLYRLKQLDFNGNFVYHSLSDEVHIHPPSRLNVFQNYPNPFNPITRIDYELPSEGLVTISLFDLNGKEIQELVNDYKQGGYQTFEIDGSLLPSGVYFYRIVFNNNEVTKSFTKRMMLIK